MKDLILNFLSQKFNKQVTEDSELVDLCQDSISTVETLFDIEKLAEVKIPEDDIFSIEKVQDLINIINKLKNVS
jgi:acyl carrier protein